MQCHNDLFTVLWVEALTSGDCVYGFCGLRCRIKGI